jgi:hypothetical protein
VNRRPYIYVASSWRNEARQQATVAVLRDWGADVYDFRRPSRGALGFSWSEIDPGWKDWTGAELVKALEHPIARDGFRADMNALKAADLVVLVLPCGRSAHLELGHAVGAGKPTAVLLTDDNEPELMYSMCDFLTTEIQMLGSWAHNWAENLGFDTDNPFWRPDSQKVEGS